MRQDQERPRRASQCVQCPSGKADTDSDSTTQCLDCSIGEYCGEGVVNPVLCADGGQFDDDRDPSTPCSDTDICLQVCQAGTEDDDCDDMDIGEYREWDPDDGQAFVTDVDALLIKGS